MLEHDGCSIMREPARGDYLIDPYSEVGFQNVFRWPEKYCRYLTTAMGAAYTRRAGG